MAAKKVTHETGWPERRLLAYDALRLRAAASLNECLTISDMTRTVLAVRCGIPLRRLIGILNGTEHFDLREIAKISVASGVRLTFVRVS